MPSGMASSPRTPRVMFMPRIMPSRNASGTCRRRSLRGSERRCRKPSSRGQPGRRWTVSSSSWRPDCGRMRRYRSDGPTSTSNVAVWCCPKRRPGAVSDRYPGQRSRSSPASAAGPPAHGCSQRPEESATSSGSRRCGPRSAAAAGLEDVHLHDLRHTVGAAAASSGTSLVIVGRMLGHRKARSTERYAHVAPDVAADAADDVAGEIERAIKTWNTRP